MWTGLYVYACPRATYLERMRDGFTNYSTNVHVAAPYYTTEYTSKICEISAREIKIARSRITRYVRKNDRLRSNEKPLTNVGNV